MARKPNYNFEKRRKELDRKAKKEAKLADRRRRDEEPSATPEETAAPAAAEE